MQHIVTSAYARNQGQEPGGDARKACPRCRELKSVSDFHRKYADDPSSTQTYCRRCHGDMKRERGKVRRMSCPLQPVAFRS